MKQHVPAGDHVVLICVASNPTLGGDFSQSPLRWPHNPDIHEADSTLVHDHGNSLDESYAEFVRNDYEVVLAEDGAYAVELAKVLAALDVPQLAQYAIQPPSTSRLTPET